MRPNGKYSGPAKDLLAAGTGFKTFLADPPWRFQNKTGKVAPEHRRLSRYATMTLDEICALPLAGIAAPVAHLYLWCPNALLPDGLRVMAAWGFTYKANIVWHKIRKDGGSDGRGVGVLCSQRDRIDYAGQKRANLDPRPDTGRLFGVKET